MKGGENGAINREGKERKFSGITRDTTDCGGELIIASFCQSFHATPCPKRVRLVYRKVAYSSFELSLQSMSIVSPRKVDQR